MMFPLVRDLAGDGIPVTVTCRVLKLCRQQYYRWIEAPISDAELDEAYLANAIFDAHRDDPEVGYRFLADEVRTAGWEVSDRVVWRICRDMGWWSVFGKPKRAKASKPGAPAHDDLVCRQLHRGCPNTVWLADITEHRTGEGKLYLCAIKDLFSNRIVGWAIDERMKGWVRPGSGTHPNADPYPHRDGGSRQRPSDPRCRQVDAPLTDTVRHIGNMPPAHIGARSVTPGRR